MIEIHSIEKIWHIEVRQSPVLEHQGEGEASKTLFNL